MCFSRVVWGQGTHAFYWDTRVVMRRLCSDFARVMVRVCYNMRVPTGFGGGGGDPEGGADAAGDRAGGSSASTVGSSSLRSSDSLSHVESNKENNIENNKRHKHNSHSNGNGQGQGHLHVSSSSHRNMRRGLGGDSGVSSGLGSGDNGGRGLISEGGVLSGDSSAAGRSLDGPASSTGKLSVRDSLTAQDRPLRVVLYTRGTSGKGRSIQVCVPCSLVLHYCVPSFLVLHYCVVLYVGGGGSK